MAKKGIVYALTNPAFPEVRIGHVKAKPGDKWALTALKNRLRSHSSASVPHPFNLHYAVFTDDVGGAEKFLLAAFKSRRVKSKNRRDFFEITPNEAEAAMKLLLIHGILTDEIERRIQADRPDYKNALPQPKGKGRFKFADARIDVGTVLTFLRDREFKVEVADAESQKVRFLTKGFDKNPMSLGKATLAVFHKIKHRGVKWKGIRGALYWEYKGKTIGDIFAKLRG